MDFLKKHYEMIAVAVALVALTASAIMLSLKVDALNSELGQTPRGSLRSEAVPHINASSYSNAIVALEHPPLWTNAPTDPFMRVGSTQVSTAGGTEATTNGLQIVLMSITRKPFKLLFKAYSYDSDKQEGYNFQINFQFRARTFFVRAAGDAIKDRYEDTGYRIVSFQRKFTMVNDPSLGGKREKDVSELTIQHEGEKPVVLVLLQETEEQEPVAKVRCGATGPEREYRRGQRIECGGKTYKVVDIDPVQMVIVDTQTEEQHVIKPQQ
ncbi:MAG TPA: hypothetical protein VL486_11465 [Verrucomicrobiae bacterium]|nr:hypothetical protein [Verrucomicrobiae bacterium]